MTSLGASKQAKLMAISVAPSFNYTNAKRTSVAGFTLVQTLDNATGSARKTSFNGQPAFLLDQTTQATCTGDEAGWAGGVKSGTVGKEVKPTSGSSSILVEGKQLVREGDSCTMNNGNTVGKYVRIPNLNFLDMIKSLKDKQEPVLSAGMPIDIGKEIPMPIFPVRELPIAPQIPKLTPKLKTPKIDFPHIPSPLSSKIDLDREVTSAEMYAHYLYGNGESLTLDNLGATKSVSNAILKRGAFDRKGSIQTRFTEQIAEKFLKGDTDYTFDNGYDFGSEIGIWAFGSGDLSGKFNGNINRLKSGEISVVGEVTYQFEDVFEDPYDTWDNFEGSWDPNGTPYRINGEIKHNINDVVTLKKGD